MLTLILSLLLLIFPKHVIAIYDPLSVTNNRYGMHIADLGDISDVAPLVNSGGGDWGYITLVASDNDRDLPKWQGYFNQMRRLHLIPIVRLATHVTGDHWVAPDPDRFEEIVSFFNTLNWPVQNRYIVLFNEPNHAKEWGNTLEPESYGQIAIDLARKFKAASDDFFILPAGLDVSAASDESSMDAVEFLQRVVKSQPEFLSVLDGWTSHSYPNPGFSGSPFSFGRGTLHSYDWELSIIQSLGLSKRLPVFITETGWTHREGVSVEPNIISSQQVGNNLLQAADGAWADEKIAAITPFVFNYQDFPFDHFSWKRLSGDGGYYAQYEMYNSIKKSRGTPRQKELYELSDPILPLVLVSGSSYTLSAQIQNNGQGILSSDGYELTLEDPSKTFVLIADPLPSLEPGQKDTISIHIKSPVQTGNYRVSLTLVHQDSVIPIQTQDIRVVAPPSLIIEAPLGWRRQAMAGDVTVLVYEDKTLLHKFTGLSIKDGNVRVRDLTNILPGHPYRVVILVPFYLPRQIIQPLVAGQTAVVFRRLLPLDFNRDGALTTKDLFSMIRLKPNFIISLFVGN